MLQETIAEVGGCGTIIQDTLERQRAPQRRLEKLYYILIVLTMVSLALVALIEPFLPEQVIVGIMVLLIWHHQKIFSRLHAELHRS
jgi:hypothetical protein